MESIWTPFTHPSLNRAVVLAREIDVHPGLAPLLCRLDLFDPETAQRFLFPKLKALADPFLLPDMEVAVLRILAAIEGGEKIVLYGDYDVDGVTSLAILHRMLVAYGARPECFLPMRVDEGYGLSAEGIERCLGTFAPKLLIAVDCGTSSRTEIDKLRKNGIHVVVLDHHECPSGRPDCAAVVNPKLGSDFRYLCTAGIAFKVCHALLKRRPLPGFDLKDFLDLVAIGTVADLVPLTSENRLLVRHGLKQLEKTRWIGLRALMQVAAVKLPVRASDIGFRLGPRLNAAGRLGTAQDALDLLLCDSEPEAWHLASALNQQNVERQTIERRTSDEALAMLADFSPETDRAIVLGSKNWNTGVIGIVASRLTKKFHRPSIVVGFDEAGIGKGSGRSINGWSLVNALGDCAEWLEKFGGHEMAAGLTVREEVFQNFAEAFKTVAWKSLDDGDLHLHLHLDGEILLAEIDLNLLDCQDRFEPFGVGNQRPVYFARGVLPAIEPRILKDKHVKLRLSQRGVVREAIFFNGTGAVPPPPWDVAFHLETNTFRDETTAQMQVVALRKAVLNR
ncbi:MAG TPA: single-stranded-DNA-specific exonuclease RecJ [Chthoniobacterales bacterium]